MEAVTGRFSSPKYGDQPPDGESPDTDHSGDNGLSTSIAIGVAIGVAIGAAMGNMGIGIAIGVALGAAGVFASKAR